MINESSSSVFLQEQHQQSVLEGTVLDQNFTRAVKQSFLTLTKTMDSILDILQMTLSFTFITVFIQ